MSEFRPQSFDDIVGQKEVVEYLRLKVKSCQMTGNPPGHILFLGPAGSGKTTLANVLSNELGEKIKSISAARMDNWNKILGVISNLDFGNVLFIDEIHALSNKVQENLYDVMEDFFVDIFVGPPRASRAVTMNVPRFTLVGATTHAGDLNGPLLRRFDYKPMLSPYSLDELEIMIESAALRMYEEGCPGIVSNKIAQLSRRSAAIAYSLLRSYKEMEVVMEDISPLDILYHTIRMEKLDPWIGLDYASRRYLSALVQHYPNPIGVERMSSIINEQVETIKWVIEPFLLSQVELEGSVGQLIEVDRAGRRATDLAKYYIFLCKWNQETEGLFPGERFPGELVAK